MYLAFAALKYDMGMMYKMLELIKKQLKKSKSFNKLLKYKVLIPIYFYDFKLFYKYSMTVELNTNKSIELDIIVISHIIEKGLAHKNFRTCFAKNRVEYLSKCIYHYSKITNYNRYILCLGIDALKKYYEIHKSYGKDVSEYCYWPLDITGTDDYVGAIPITGKDLFKDSNSNFYDFAISRHSVRLFDDNGEGIDTDVLIKCINLAMVAPSACNRQATRIHLVLDRNKIRSIAELQGGCNGFGESADALIVLTSDLNLYTGTDRRLPMIDNGIFAMNLLYSLHYYNIAACILNGSLPVKTEQKIKENLNIRPNEIIGTIIIANKVRDDSKIMVGKAKRRDGESITTIYK